MSQYEQTVLNAIRELEEKIGEEEEEAFVAQPTEKAKEKAGWKEWAKSKMGLSPGTSGST